MEKQQMNFSMLSTFDWFRGCMVIFAVVLCGWLIWKLHQFFFRRFQSFFNLYACTDKKITRHLNRLAWNLTVLLPVWVLTSSLWIRVIQNQTEIFGISFGNWMPAVYLTVNLLLLIFAFHFLAFFVRCYQAQQGNVQRPIRPVIRFLSAILFLLGILFIVMAFTRERPMVFLSTIGGAAALFIFAFQNLISSVVSNFQINAEKMLKIGDWVVIKAKGVDGIVESIGTMTIRVRNWDKSLISFPIRLLQDETLINYQSMMEYGARRIERSLLIDQRSIRFLTGDEVAELKKLHLVTDEMLKKSDAFPETDDLAGEHCWTNIELFTLYAEDYLHRRPDIRHDIWCLVRAHDPTSTGLALELFCYATQTPLVKFAPIQRSILFHLLAILPSFRLRVFQKCSDIRQEIGDMPDKVGSAFRYDHLKNPVYPSDRQ